jgi:hypothetical protein
VPGDHVRALGLRPRGKRLYELADGTEVTLDITVAEIEFMGETVGATVTFGPDDVEPILGVTALESVGIEVGPRSQRLKRLPAVRLKRTRSMSFASAGQEDVFISSSFSGCEHEASLSHDVQLPARPR